MALLQVACQNLLICYPQACSKLFLQVVSTSCNQSADDKLQQVLKLTSFLEPDDELLAHDLIGCLLFSHSPIKWCLFLNFLQCRLNVFNVIPEVGSISRT